MEAGKKKKIPEKQENIQLKFESQKVIKTGNFTDIDESQKIQIIGRIYLVGRGIWGSDLRISKFGFRSAAGTVEISTKQ